MNLLLLFSALLSALSGIAGPARAMAPAAAVAKVAVGEAQRAAATASPARRPSAGVQTLRQSAVMAPQVRFDPERVPLYLSRRRE